MVRESVKTPEEVERAVGLLTITLTRYPNKSGQWKSASGALGAIMWMMGHDSGDQPGAYFGELLDDLEKALRL